MTTTTLPPPAVGATQAPRPIRAATTETPLVRWLLIGLALAFLTFFLFVPLTLVFVEAFKKGVDVYLASIVEEDALAAVRLVGLVNDVSLRNLIPGELAKGFGFYQSKPATTFSPVAVTPDELGDAWRDGRVQMRLHVQWNGERFGAPHGGENKGVALLIAVAAIAILNLDEAGELALEDLELLHPSFEDALEDELHHPLAQAHGVFGGQVPVGDAAHAIGAEQLSGHRFSSRMRSRRISILAGEMRVTTTPPGALRFSSSRLKEVTPGFSPERSRGRASSSGPRCDSRARGPLRVTATASGISLAMTSPLGRLR